MVASRQFLLSSYLVTLSGVLSLFASGVVSTSLWLGFSAVFTTLFFLEGSRFQLSERWGTALATLFLFGFLIGWNRGLMTAELFERGLVGGFGFLIQSVVGIKLAQKKGYRDWVFLYLLSFFSVLLSAAIDLSPSFIFSLSMHIGLTISSLFLLEILRAESRLKFSSESPSLLPRKTVVVSLVITMLVILASIPLFFLLPRLGAAGLGQGITGLNSQSGFSDSVRLGAIGSIQLNDAIVLRGKVEGVSKDDVIRWRGVGLDNFDNKTWSNSFREVGTRLDKEQDLFLLKRPIGEGRFVTQDIYIEPMDSNVLFMMADPIAIQGPFQSLEVNKDDSYRIRTRGFQRLNYRATSILRNPDLHLLREEKSQYLMSDARYLQVPKDLDTRIAILASSVLTRNSKRNIYDDAKAIETHLRSNYGYTLEQKAGGQQPLADFLFNVREGHCEYFATAMAVMLRTQGIATRVVNGFQAGEFNDSTGFWIARQRDAHSWVEVYFPDSKQWVAFDPTPPTDQVLAGNAGILSDIRRLTDTVETLWIQYFVSYDESGQQSIVASAFSGAKEFQISINDGINQIGSRVKGLFSALSLETLNDDSSGFFFAVVIVLLFGSLAIVLIVIAIRWLRARIEKRKYGITPKFFSELVGILKQYGHIRRSNETPREFAARTGIPQAVELIEIFYSIRFGYHLLDDALEQRINELLRDLRKRLHAS